MNNIKYSIPNKSLSSKLNNRIEIWGKVKIESSLGITYEEQLIKKLWADIIPRSGFIKSEVSETESNTLKFLIKIRKTEIITSNFIVFKNMKYEIEYIIPDYNNSKILELYATLKQE